ncbi:unnamed protein product, partial [Symbiodinium sp. CCMP2456]
VFTQLRDLAIQQNFKADDQEGSDKAFKLHFALQDVPMCRGAFARLHLMGVSPRLTSLQKNVMQGKRLPDVDVRYLKKSKGKQRSSKSGEVFSYLQSLYESVAETLPENDNTREDFDDSDKEEVKQSNDIILLHSKPDSSDPLTQEDRVRYLPPGSMFETYKQYLALKNTYCCFTTFVAIWRDHFSHMLFRQSQQHAVCAVCTQHKLLIKCLSHNLKAQNKQRCLYERHLAAQYEDRQLYWRVRGRSRSGPDSQTLSLIIDSVDQQKCSWPRARAFKSKQFDAFQRPRLHVTACLAHGYSALIFLSHSDVSQCGSTTVEEILGGGVFR